MRSKEDAHDYRYFPDPDLPPLVISNEWIDRVRADMPELPEALRERLVREHGLSDYDAAMVAASRASADYFFATVASGTHPDPKQVANWMMGELASALNRESMDIAQSRVSPAQLAGIIARISDGTVSNKIGRDIFSAIWSGDYHDADAAIDGKGLRQIQDTGLIEGFVNEVIAANPKMVEEFRGGKEKALNALVGQVMKKSQGKANPQQVTDIFKQKLG
jgi:aspartyl-tRNA(Asn)/glutamyl-tRNA(Gln) amidotransferase subunit B